MNKLNRLSFALIAAASPMLASAEPLADLVAKGTSCKPANGYQDCTYKVGSGLEFSIGAVGSRVASISFLRSDARADYYARFGVSHGCVIVTPGEASKGAALDFAFVSPRTGKVYRDWRACAPAPE